MGQEGRGSRITDDFPSIAARLREPGGQPRQVDGTSWLRPTVHFRTRSAQPWVTLSEGGTRFETQPADGLAWLRSIGDSRQPSGR
jgi:hypothetical protein